MAQLPVTRVTNIMTSDLTLTACNAGGDRFKNTPGTIALFRNGSGGPLTVTIAAQRTGFQKPGVGNLPVANISRAIAAGGTWAVAVPMATHTDGDGDAVVTYSGVTSLTAVILQPDV